jgi:hypothetical protein
MQIPEKEVFVMASDDQSLAVSSLFLSTSPTNATPDPHTTTEERKSYVSTPISPQGDHRAIG